MTIPGLKIILPVVAALFFTSCGFFDQSKEKEVIKVGLRGITEDELTKNIRAMSSEFGMTVQNDDDFFKLLIDKIVDNYLILEYGREHGIRVTEEELESAVNDIKRDYPDKLFEDMLMQSYVDHDEWRESFRRYLLLTKIIRKVSEKMPPIPFHEIKSYFDTHSGEFRRKEGVKFQQIISQSREEAKKIRDRLSKGDDLDKMAIRYSLTTDTEQGAETGWISRGLIEKDLEDVMFSLPIGEISPVIKTAYGYHIIKVLDKQPEGQRSLPDVAEEIEKRLSRVKSEAFIDEWLKQLKEKFPVHFNQEALKQLARKGYG